MPKTGQQVKKESVKKPKDAAVSDIESKSEKKALNLKPSEMGEEVSETEQATVDLEELEEQEDAASAEATSGGGNAAALAAANGSTEMSASFKNFRHHPDMENFYRFIYENDLRHEALAIVDEIMAEKVQKRLVKASKAQPH